jgi:dTDP-N-acetylfucosamine:lipid II N-acetylfucosaminyltransferase
MKKIIHLHSDHKFVSDSERFRGEYFINELLILDTKNSSNKDYHNKALFIEPNPDNIGKIVEIVNSADALVLYNLDFYKSQIVNRVDAKVKVIWRFFGTELYSRKLYLYLSTKSRSFLKPRLLKDQVKRTFPFFFHNEILFYRAIRRTDAIICVFKEEYDYLKSLWGYLPKFIPWSLESPNFYSKKIDFKTEYPKKNLIIVGNSRSYYNNHLNTLELIESRDLDQKLNIKLLFNYGSENKYTQEVREKVDCIPAVSLIDSFIPPNEFVDFYGPVAAFVNNSYRQMALGNIFMALYRGVKVYLNKNNPTYTWLKTAGIFIYDIKDFQKDLETGQYYLTKEEILHNLNCLENLEASNTPANLQSQILEVLNK